VRDLGYRIVIAALHGLPAFGEFVDFIGLPEVRPAEQRYATGDS
jgi:hypothetical protein